jgi:hypothetical protein
MVDASLPRRDEPGDWVLEFAYKPMRILTVDIPGKGRRKIHYLYHRVVNRTGEPRKFAPRFIMVNDKGEEFEDDVVPRAIPVIQRREEPSISVLGSANIMGILPPSSRSDADNAVYGVATWEKWDDTADRFRILVRGLSDGYKEIPSPSGGKPLVKYRTLKIDFIRERETQLADPPHEWCYW